MSKWLRILANVSAMTSASSRTIMLRHSFNLRHSLADNGIWRRTYPAAIFSIDSELQVEANACPDAVAATRSIGVVDLQIEIGTIGPLVFVANANPQSVIVAKVNLITVQC